MICIFIRAPAIICYRILNMHVLFQIREDYNKNIAGDSIQMLMTKNILKSLGCRLIFLVPLMLE